MEGGDDGCEQVGIAFVKLFPQFVADAVDDGAVFDAHEVNPGIHGPSCSCFLVGEDGDHVNVGHFGVDYGAAALVFFEEVQFAFDGISLFEAQGFGMGVHLTFEVVENFAEVAFEDAAYVFDGGEVVGLALEASAGGSAQPNLMFHAGPLAHVFAGAVLEKRADDVLQLA